MEEQDNSQLVNEATDKSVNLKQLLVGNCSNPNTGTFQMQHERCGKKPAGTKMKSAIFHREHDALVTILKALVDSGKAATSDVSTKQGDGYDLFGQCVANELRNITDDFARDQAKQEINAVLFRAKWNVSCEVCNNQTQSVSHGTTTACFNNRINRRPANIFTTE
jgi:hypothetical protein